MKHNGTRKKRALLAGSELDIRQTLSRYLQLNGLDVVEVDSIQEVLEHLSGDENFDLLVTELVTPKRVQWYEWNTLLARESDDTLLVSTLEPLASMPPERIHLASDPPLDHDSFGWSTSKRFSQENTEPCLTWNPYEDDPYQPDPYAPR